MAWQGDFQQLQKFRSAAHTCIICAFVLVISAQALYIKEKATELLAHPIVLSKEQILHIRYAIGDCIWDLKEPRSHAEAIGTGVVLYEMLANFYLQSHGHWGTSGKWLSTSITQSKP